MAILSNLLLETEAEATIKLTGTDTEIEISAQCPADILTPGNVTLPARKLLDICRAFPDQAQIEIDCHDDKAFIRSGKSRFQLATLPGQDFPRLQLEATSFQTALLQAQQLRAVIERVHYAMALQDVRYYLNGLLLELGGGWLRAVASDGHRLALCETHLPADYPVIQALLSRKAVLELLKQLDEPEAQLQLEFSSQALQMKSQGASFVCKLIDASYPEYSRVIPKPSGRSLTGSRSALQQALARVAVLAGDKFNGVVMALTPTVASIFLRNSDLEEAQEELTLSYQGSDMEVGYNVKYLLDAINALGGENLHIEFSEQNQSALLRDPTQPDHLAVVMPMLI
jgi:DNA polymerase-3 subunit beta